MNRICALLAVAGALAGCAQAPTAPSWTHVSKGAPDFERDRARCEYESTAATQTGDPSMRSAIGQGIEMGVRRGQLFRLCMRAAGWSDGR